MNTATTAVMAWVVAPTTVPSCRAHSTWNVSPLAPDTANSRRRGRTRLQSAGNRLVLNGAEASGARGLAHAEAADRLQQRERLEGLAEHVEAHGRGAFGHQGPGSR